MSGAGGGLASSGRSLHAVVDEWAGRLGGLSIERIAEARARIEALGIEHLTDELCRRPDVDAVVGACILASSLDALAERGVPGTKLAGKLRGDLEVWPSVTEIVAGRLLLPFFEPQAELEMDHGNRSDGPNADFRLSAAGSSGEGVKIEFKAVGLSVAEVSFFRGIADALPGLVPQSGVVTYHLPFSESPPLIRPLEGEKRELMEVDNRRVRSHLPEHVRNIRGAVAAGYLTEDAFVDRARDRVEEALRQLEGDEESWVALWWSNGASLLSIRDALSEIRLPDHVLGLMVVGAAVIVPDPRIHYFHVCLPRPDLDDGGQLPVLSLEDDPTAAPILSIFERSVGSRPTLLVSPEDGEQPVLFRDGSRRIFPFNFMVGADSPPE
jgi:hypothetical protein